MAMFDAARRETRRERDRLSRTEEVRAAIATLAGLSDEARAEDPKLAAVQRALTSHPGNEPRANILVYTEYTDSQDALVAHLAEATRSGELSGRRPLPLGRGRRPDARDDHRSVPRGGRHRPRQHRRLRRGPQPPPALPPPDPPRAALQPEPARAAQRPHRSLRPEARPRGPLPLPRRHLRGATPPAPRREVRAAARAPHLCPQHPRPARRRGVANHRPPPRRRRAGGREPLQGERSARPLPGRRRARNRHVGLSGAARRGRAGDRGLRQGGKDPLLAGRGGRPRGGAARAGGGRRTHVECPPRGRRPLHVRPRCGSDRSRERRRRASGRHQLGPEARGALGLGPRGDPGLRRRGSGRAPDD